MKNKVAVFGNKFTTRTLVKYLYENGLQPSSVITLSDEKKQKLKISDADILLERYCEKIGVKVYSPSKYNLSDHADIEFFEKEQFDLGICVGWQRLISPEVLACFKHGIYGWHGSMFRFPDGRGRSPINWSIRLGAEKIYHNLFQYNEKADAGSIFETECIPIKPSDLISDVIEKAVVHICQSSTRLINSLENNCIKLLSQAKGTSVQFPKLTESDGWLQPDLMTSERCKNLIRAASRPFPGAYIKHENKIIFKVWNVTADNNISLLPGQAFFTDKILCFHTLDGVVCSGDFEVTEPEFNNLKGRDFNLL